jgi:hypothetical protein
MIDAIREIIPKEAALGLLACACMAWLAAGPISERVAVRDHLPRCIIGQMEAGGEQGLSTLDPQQELALGLTQELMRKLPGGLGDMMGDVVTSAERLAEARRRKAAETVARTAPDRCRCRMRLALDMTRMDFALWVGTLKVYQPASVRDFGSVMATVDKNNICEKTS